MKILKNFFFVLFLAFNMLSCESFLDKEPDDMLTLEMVFNQKTRVEEWLAGIYSYVMDSYMDNFERHSFLLLGDDCTVPTELEQFRVWSIGAMQGNWNPTTNTRVDIWGDTYKAVRQALIFIDNVKPIPSQKLTETQVEMMKLEARFLIAYYYQQMLEIFGPFPLVTSLVSADASVNDLMLYRTPYDEILNWIDKEYTDLAEKLPVRIDNPENYYGKPTRGVVLAAQARLWLFAASPLFNGNPDYVNIKDNQGRSIFTANYDPTRWRKAADACKALINLAENENVYQLYREYYNESTRVIDPFLSLQNLFMTRADANNEIIFARPASFDLNHSYYDKLCFPRGMGGFGPFAVTQALVDDFYMKDGMPIDRSPLYKETGLSTTAVSYPHTNWDQSDANRTRGLITPNRTFNMYVNREPRFYVSVRYNEQYVTAGRRNIDFFLDGLDGRPSFDTPPTGYMVRKRVNPDFNLANGYSPYRPAILMRLGEYYLNYVEALNEVEPTHSDILKYLNLIRERAGIPVYGAGTGEVPIPDSQTKMREAIRAERRVELCLEGARYHDIRRWKIAEDVFSKPIMGMDIYKKSSQKQDFYKRTKYLDVVFSKKNYLWPIPQYVIDNNKNILQNPFWRGGDGS